MRHLRLILPSALCLAWLAQAVISAEEPSNAAQVQLTRLAAQGDESTAAITAARPFAPAVGPQTPLTEAFSELNRARLFAGLQLPTNDASNAVTAAIDRVIPTAAELTATTELKQPGRPAMFEPSPDAEPRK